MVSKALHTLAHQHLGLPIGTYVCKASLEERLHFREGVGAVENLAFRRLMVTTEKTVIRPKDSIWGQDFKESPVLNRTKKGDHLHPGPMLGAAFPRSNEKWTAEDILEPPESDKSGDDGASDNDHEEAEDKNKEKGLTTPHKNDKENKEEELSQGPMYMEVEPSEDQKSKRSGLNLSLGDPARASTPTKTMGIQVAAATLSW